MALDRTWYQTLGKHRFRRDARPSQIRAWLDSLTEFSDQIPAVPGETFSRGMIYDDHGHVHFLRRIAAGAEYRVKWVNCCQ